MFLDTYNILFAGLRFSPEFPLDRDSGEKQINDISVFYEPVRSAGSPGRFTGKSLSPDILPNYMNLSCQNPAFVIVILRGIATFTTTGSDDHTTAASKVSQETMSPLARPASDHFTRCAYMPCVKESGTT